MSSTASTVNRGPAHRDPARMADPLTLVPAGDQPCWQLLHDQIPLTLLLDLALPSPEDLASIYEELLHEPAGTDWVPRPRPAS
jgi:hypothetical protein